VSFARRLR